MAMDESRLYTANELFENLNIPFRYLRKQLTILSKSELITSEQGKKGGYHITKSTEEIFLSDILTATMEQKGNDCFFGFESCALQAKCVMHDKWAEMQDILLTMLTTTNLAELINKGPQAFKLNKSFLNIKND